LLTGRDQTLLDQEMMVAKLNRMMIGWANYFCLAPVSKAVSGGIPARNAGPRLPYQADEQFPVGDIVNCSPRAGWLKQARPVR